MASLLVILASMSWLHDHAHRQLQRCPRLSDNAPMAQHVARLSTGLRVRPFARAGLYLARIVAVGLIAIGVSGAVCGLIGYGYGDHTLAADSQSAHLSASRCADLTEYHPEKTDCIAAEMAHHADEIVEYRVAAGVLGLLAIAGYVIVRSRAALTESESREQRRRYLWIATGAFGLAAAILLGIGTGVQLGSGDAAPRWFADGSVSFVFFVLHALWRARANAELASLGSDM
ncbi:MAG: hypothetical protein ACHQO8_10635 [Vicinamibacterales bacterium]